MNKRKKMLMIALLSVAVLPLGAQKKWTLDDCISYAMQNNITLQKSRLQQQSAAEDVKAQKGVLLPTVSASTNQSLGYQPWKDTGMMTVTNGVVNSNVKKTSYNGNYSVNGQWTVWNGGRNTKTVALDQLAEQQADLQMQETANILHNATPRSLIVLDEPELGLHPDAIGKLGGIIRMASHHAQVLLATQSTRLVDEFDPEEIVIVERDKER